MNRFILCTFLSNFFFWTATLFGQSEIPNAKLTKFKKSTACVKYPNWTEAGTLIKKDGDFAFVVANKGFALSKTNIQVCFNPGLSNELVLQAKVVAESENLVLLMVPSKGLPQPIKMPKTQVDLAAYRVFYCLGCPGNVELDRRANRGARSVPQPSQKVRVQECTVSRSSPFQMSFRGSSRNKGYGGGPVVSPRGELVGFVKTDRGTNNGQCVLVSELQSILKGRVENMKHEFRELADDRVGLTVYGKLIDPMSNIKRLSVSLAPAEKVGPVDPSADRFEKMKSITETIIFEQRATRQGVSIAAMFNLDAKKLKGGYYYQVSKQTRKGVEYLKPVKVQSYGYVPTTKSNIRNKKPRARKPKPARIVKRTTKPVDISEIQRRVESANKILMKRPNLSQIDSRFLTLKPSGGSIGKEVLESSMKEFLYKTYYGGAEDYLPNLVWNKRNDGFFLLSRKGVLKNVNFETYRTTEEISLGCEPLWIGACSEGLLVLADRYNLLLIRESDLKVSDVLRVPGAESFASSRTSSKVFLSSGGFRPALRVVDLQLGKVIGKYGSDILPSYRYPTLTPDSRYLICLAGDFLCRFKNNDGELALEQIGTTRYSGYKMIDFRFDVSSDSKYFSCCPFPRAFKVSDLDDAVMDMMPDTPPEESEDASSICIGIDPVYEEFYTADKYYLVERRNKVGDLESRVKQLNKRENIVQILMHPEGRKMLLLGKKRIYSVRVEPLIE